MEGYWETIRKVFAANTTGDEEAAAIAQLHSIAAGLLNTGYYARFFKEERKLGSGSFASVYLCTHIMDEIELGVFAVKKLALGDDAGRLRQVVREVKALERLRHINVIDYKHSWLEIDRHSEMCPYVPFLFILMAPHSAETAIGYPLRSYGALLVTFQAQLHFGLRIRIIGMSWT